MTKSVSTENEIDALFQINIGKKPSVFNAFALGIPPLDDINFTIKYRSSAWVAVPQRTNTLQEYIDAFNYVRLASIDSEVRRVVDDVAKNRVAGKQTNLLGYSYGSVVVAHAAIALSDAGIQVDHLILIGSPISDQLDLYNDLLASQNIKCVIRWDIPGDPFSNTKDNIVIGAFGKTGDDAPHFDLARPDNPETPNNEEEEANNKIRELSKFLISQGVK